ncbi:MAG: zf-HC2 domain-containing protein [Bacteroidales bacterium]|jgi:predicted anti-sigma-YlaC factor YlaD|nr:zf-HC2 domain-containing protein [Bacteroidales bacterium]
MKCINDALIQRYIDGETDVLETEQIEKHIENCSSCVDKIEEQKVFANAIKNELQKFSNPFVTVPEFTTPSWAEVNLRRTIGFKHFVYYASAACVAAIMLFVLLPKKHEKDVENKFVMFSVINDFDANRTFSQQEKSIFIVDGDGKIIDII